MAVPMLSRPLVLEAPQDVPDGAGGFTRTWAALGTVWGQVRPALGREVSSETHPMARMRYRITVRSAPDGSPQRPTVAQRFRDGTRVFHILSVQDRDDRGRYLTCLVEEEVVA